MKYIKECIRTFSGLSVDPYRLVPEDIAKEDIAHSLSMQARANGHFRDFYSVAQHSINCAKEAKNRAYGRRVVLACLLHDAAEAYIADIPRPVKHRLQGFAEIEDAVERAIFSVFGLPDLTQEERDAVREIDDAMLYAEFEALAGLKVFDTAPCVSMAHDFSVRDIADVESEFLSALSSVYKDGGLQTVIEKADVADAEEILALQKTVYLSEAEIYSDYTIPPLVQTKEGITREFDNHVFLKAVYEGRIIGSVRASASDGVCKIFKLAVHPDFQNRGIGSGLIIKIEETFGESTRFELFTGQRSEKNIRLYQKHGYIIFKTEKLRDGLCFVFLEKMNDNKGNRS